MLLAAVVSSSSSSLTANGRHQQSVGTTCPDDSVIDPCTCADTNDAIGVTLDCTALDLDDDTVARILATLTDRRRQSLACYWPTTPSLECPIRLALFNTSITSSWMTTRSTPSRPRLSTLAAAVAHHCPQEEEEEEEEEEVSFCVGINCKLSHQEPFKVCIESMPIEIAIISL